MFSKLIVGYSGHEMNLTSSVAAVVLGKNYRKAHNFR